MAFSFGQAGVPFGGLIDLVGGVVAKGVQQNNQQQATKKAVIPSKLVQSTVSTPQEAINVDKILPYVVGGLVFIAVIAVVRK